MLMLRYRLNIISFITSFMPRSKQEEGAERPKNIKNIYIHKINSLMKISRDNLAEDEMENFSAKTTRVKKIKKAVSELDKKTLKLEKNRECARKARERKNIYFKLLESHVAMLKEMSVEGAKIEQQSSRLYEKLKNNKKEDPEEDDDLDRYLSNSDLGGFREHRIENESSKKNLDEIINQLRMAHLPVIIRNIKNLNQKKKNELTDQICQQSDLKKEHSDPKNSKNLLKQLFFEQAQIEGILNKIERINTQLKQFFIFRHQNDEDPFKHEHIKTKVKLIVHELGICGVRCPSEYFLNLLNDKQAKSNDESVASIDDIVSNLISYDHYGDKVMPMMLWEEEQDKNI